MATILIAEDRDLDRKYLATLLTSYGHRVIQVSDGAQALAESIRHKPDLVISDVLMPTIDGYEFVRRLRGVPDVAQTPVIFYTASYHAREASRLAQQCGVTDILTKPSEPEAMMAKIDAVLGRPSVATEQPSPATFAREHLRVVSDKLVEKSRNLEANELRLATVVDLCHRFTSQLDPLAMLQDVCAAARDVTLAQYATVGIANEDRTEIVHYLTSGMDTGAVQRLDPPPIDAPLLRRILENREALRGTNPGGRPESVGLAATAPPMSSFLGVPIASATRVYGWIGLRTKLGAEEFNREDERIAVMIGTHAGIAYENTLLVEDLRARQVVLEQHRRLALFQADIGVTLAGSTDLQEMLQQCAEAMVEHLDAAFARFWILNVTDQVLELKASAGMYTHLTGPHGRVPVGAFKIGLIAKERVPHITNTVIGDPCVNDQEWAVREGMVSFAGYPLIVGEDLVGVMAMFARKPLSDNTLNAMGSVASGIATGIARKLAEGQLRRTLERTTFAMEAARMGVWELDLVSDRLTWSDTMAPVFGLRPDQAPANGEAFFALIHPDDQQAVMDSVSRATREGTAYTVEFRIVWPDGGTHWLAGRARVMLGTDGTPVRLLGVGMDISDRKMLEAQLQQAQKLEAVGQLAGGVAHDFNNLLTAILGYSNFVLDTFQANDKRKADLEEVVKAGQRAVTLTRQLLAFSRKQVLQPAIVNLNDLANGIQKMLGRLIGEHIELVTLLAPELHMVRADPGQLEQVLMNLVVNARDAMPTGGRVAVETANVDLDESYAIGHAPVRPGSYVMLAVSDSGIGMSAETKRRLFEPFFTTKEPGKGTGLGLATVYGIVKQSGGYIWVYSEPNKGATFKVYLPIADQTETVQAPSARDAVAPSGTETVLVVEDEESVRMLTRAILERAGYRVFDAPNPEQAEALFAKDPEQFDLLVTDVIMPGSSGPKMFERMTHRRPNLKVIYVSGYTDDAIVHQGQLDPGIEFLQKPFTVDALTRKVREVLDR